LQQSAQDVALGVKFAAGVTLEIQEYPAGLPAHLCAEEGLHDYERYFPCPSGFTLAGQPYSDISFALLEGDFAVRGVGGVASIGRCVSAADCVDRSTYAVTAVSTLCAGSHLALWTSYL
jgi:hypothetical protein